MNVTIYIENTKIDLFSDETIEIKSSIQNANDITKNTIDFSKDFTVPASEINNKVFKHYYNVDIDNGFDARIKSSARIEIDGLDYKFGKIELRSVKLKRGKPSSYQIVFYGNGVSLKDLIGNDELSDLDLSAFDHPYNDTNVYNAFAGGWLFNKSIIYPFIAAKQYYYDSTNSIQETSIVSNLAKRTDAKGIKWSDLSPAIRLIDVIEAIELKYNIALSRDFFGRAEFSSLYMWLRKDINKPVGVVTVGVDFTNEGNINDLSPGITINTTDNTLIRNDNDDKFEVLLTIEPSTGFEDVEYTYIRLRDGEERARIENVVGARTSGPPIFGQKNRTHYWQIEVLQDFEFTAKLRIRKVQFLIDFKEATFSSQSITVDVSVTNTMPKLKTIDFLKGLFSMYKLVVIQDKEDEPIYINDLNSYYAEANLFDVTPYISKKDHEVKRGDLLNEISYKFEEPTTITAIQFEKNTGVSYGDLEQKLTQDGTPTGPPIEGSKEEIKVPFEQMVYIPLTDENNASLTVQYGSVLNESAEPTNIKAHIFHNQIQNINSLNAFKFVNANNTTRDVFAVNMPSYVDGEFSTIFGAEISPYKGEIISSTLFKNYHEKYILSIFNSKRRDFIFKAKLPLAIINSLELKDVLKIYDNYYRINSYTLNLLNGDSKLELLNSFDEVLNGFNSNLTEITTDFLAKTLSVTVTNFVNLIFANSRAWISNITNIGNIVYFDVSDNTTGNLRVGAFTITNQTTFEDIEITVTQNPTTVTADNDTITADSNLITADNG